MKKYFFMIVLALSILFIVSACETQEIVEDSFIESQPTVNTERGLQRLQPASISSTPPINANVAKVALVIGNGKYDYKPLKNTVNDATDMKKVLTSIGFKVIFKTNLNQGGMDKALRQFGKFLSKNKGVGFFYYAGHGARAGGRNYLIPIDNKRIVVQDDLQYYAIDANKILSTMQKARNQVNIIVLDACRDNPYVGASRSLERGLTQMVSPRGSIIAFATSEGKTASDRSKNSRNGLFTSHLIAALKIAHKNHQRVDDMFMAVSDAVIKESHGKQEPWQQDSLKIPFCFGGCLKVANTTIVPQPIVKPSVPKKVRPKNSIPKVSRKVFRDTLKNGTKGPQMVRIPAGSFNMGSIQGNGESDEKPVHRVSIKAFAMGRYEVTFAEYDKFAEATGRMKPLDLIWGRGNLPVINVSWHSAVAYTQWLSKQTGHSYRLPTEAEWEYAARAGTKTKYWWGNKIGTNKANCYQCGSGFDYTAPVGSFKANPFGLYDTAGNVWEWTCSEYQDSYQGSEQICTNDTTQIVLRGGSWNDLPQSSRSASRYWLSSLIGFREYGFRVVRTK
jgi:formylglycine-generating enzyme required for sulfatase activity